MLDYKFHHLSSRFTAGWKTEEEKREKTEGESMKTMTATGQEVGDPIVAIDIGSMEITINNPTCRR